MDIELHFLQLTPVCCEDISHNQQGLAHSVQLQQLLHNTYPPLLLWRCQGCLLSFFNSSAFHLQSAPNSHRVRRLA